MVKKLLESLTFDPAITNMIIWLSIAVAALTIFIRVFFRNAVVRFLPGMVLIVFSVLKFLKVLPEVVNKSSLDALTEIMIFFVLGVVNICTAIIIGLIFPKEKRPRRRVRKEG